jgi:hypothetical protein
MQQSIQTAGLVAFNELSSPGRLDKHPMGVQNNSSRPEVPGLGLPVQMTTPQGRDSVNAFLLDRTPRGSIRPREKVGNSLLPLTGVATRGERQKKKRII